MIKKRLTEKSGLAHYAKDKNNIVTIDASETGLGKTLWQKQTDGELKLMAFGSRYLNHSEGNYSFNLKLEIMAIGVVSREIPFLSIRQKGISIYRSSSIRTPN